MSLFLVPFGQPWNLSVAPNVQAALSKPSAGAPQVTSTPALVVASAGVSQPSAVEVQSSGRKELPEVIVLMLLSIYGDPSNIASVLLILHCVQDLFAATYPSFHGAVPGWQTGPPRGMGFAMQYSNTAVVCSSTSHKETISLFCFAGLNALFLVTLLTIVNSFIAAYAFFYPAIQVNKSICSQ